MRGRRFRANVAHLKQSQPDFGSRNDAVSAEPEVPGDSTGYGHSRGRAQVAGASGSAPSKRLGFSGRSCAGSCSLDCAQSRDCCSSRASTTLTLAKQVVRVERARFRHLRQSSHWWQGLSRTIPRRALPTGVPRSYETAPPHRPSIGP